MANADQEPLTFRGTSNEEAENFIQSVNIQAFKERKLKDTEWITGFALTAFAGGALRWYRRLPAATRQDWELLQGAILDNVWSGKAEASSLPTPAAASAPAPAAAPPAQSNESTSEHIASKLGSLSLAQHSPRIARIRIQADDPAYNGYLSIKDGLGYSKSSITDAVVVKWSSVCFPTQLEIDGSGGLDTSYNLLCGQHLNASDACAKFGPGQTGRVMITAASSSSKHSSQTLAEVVHKNSFGKSYVTMWLVLEDLSVCPVVDQSGVSYMLTPVLRIDYNCGILMAANPNGLKQKIQEPLVQARLYLELV